jgi:hypothetical protein
MKRDPRSPKARADFVRKAEAAFLQARAQSKQEMTRYVEKITGKKIDPNPPELTPLYPTYTTIRPRR